MLIGLRQASRPVLALPRYAKRIIVQFMAACCGKSKSDTMEPELEEGATSRVHDLPDDALPLSRVHGLLDRLSQTTGVLDPVSQLQGKVKVGDTGEDEEHELDDKALRQSEQIRGSLRVTAQLWATRLAGRAL